MDQELDRLKEKRRKRLTQKKDRRRDELRKNGRNKRPLRNFETFDRSRGDWH